MTKNVSSVRSTQTPLLPTAEMLALNNRHAAELSFLEPNAWAGLIKHAFHARAIGEDAFVLAFDQDADYSSPNFLWFRNRYARFVYVDRIVVSHSARGRGFARQLYEDLFRKAADAGHKMVACEVNSNPPNPLSDAFHKALGFEPIGDADLGGGKQVRYLSKKL